MVIRDPLQLTKDIPVKQEDVGGAGAELPTPTWVRRWKRPSLDSPEKVFKKEKVDASPPKCCKKVAFFNKELFARSLAR